MKYHSRPSSIPQSTWPGRLSPASVRRSFVVQWSSSRLPISPRSMAVQILFFQTFCGLVLGSFVIAKLSNSTFYVILWDVWSSGCYTVLPCSHGCTRSWDGLRWWWFVFDTGTVDHTLRELLFNSAYSRI